MAAGVAGMACATQFLADTFNRQLALGAPLIGEGERAIYPPWAVISWSARWSETYPKPFAAAYLIVLVGLLAGIFIVAIAARRGLHIKPFGKDAWASFDDLKAANLFAPSGSVLGKFEGEIVAFDGPEHQILIGASRSGKGRGHVVPTLLATPHSMLALDVKGELADGDPRHGFTGTAGFRETLGPVLRFAPTRADSIRFNPLFEIPRGPDEVRWTQNLTDVLFGANEDRATKDFWLRSASNLVAPVILHVLYAEPLGRKTLAVVREKLRDMAKTAEEMRRTLHRKNPTTGQPEVHPEVLHAAESFLSAEERMRSGVQATAESMFGLFADPLVAANTATSDFRIADLMCGEKPVTLYLQPPSSDVQRLMPLLRTIIDVSGRTLMESQTEVGGKRKRHRLVMVLDEFPMLGRMEFFEGLMGAMAGYGVKAFLVCQSLNHITRAYGRDNVILDNCAIVTAFSASDGDTAKRIADMAGEVWEVRESETQKKPRPLLGWAQGSTTQREERRPLLLPADVRALPRDEQLIFVAGLKPIRAKKLKFDEERSFRERLRPETGARLTLTTAHDWIDVRPLGYLEAPAKAQPGSKRRPHTSGANQGDLFSPPGPKLSDLALAGFRNPDGSRQVPPPNPPPASDESAARKPRWTGV
ncbi:MAG: type IV secretory system conjugative DNA transfer family protein [Hyphomonadaceae bacterium]|nr:type IV secretory system conjugative DNA transfer family protein [Hyphomonadaceae bacterium]